MSHARTFRLTEKTYTHLHDFAKQHNLSDNAALNKLICEHQENQGQEIDILAKKVIDLLEGKYKNLFTRIRLASTMADRRTCLLYTSFYGESAKRDRGGKHFFCGFRAFRTGYLFLFL